MDNIASMAQLYERKGTKGLMNKVERTATTWGALRSRVERWGEENSYISGHLGSVLFVLLYHIHGRVEGFASKPETIILDIAENAMKLPIDSGYT